MQIAGTVPGKILLWQHARFSDKHFYCTEEFSVEVRHVFKEMPDQLPGGFRWFDVFLSAHMAVAAMEICSTVETYFLSSFMAV